MDKINTKINNIFLKIEKYNNVFLFLLFLVFLFSRVLFLGKRPYGVHVDEIAQALDAKYISQYGMDRNMDRMPVYFKNYGGGMNALYAYLLAIVFKFAPFTVTSMRIPAVLCGCLCFYYSYRLVGELFENKSYGLLGAFLITIMPYYMASERWSLESNLFLSLITVAMYYFVCAIKKQKTKDYILAGIWIGICLYTYAISYMVLPVFLLMSFVLCLLKKRFNLRNWVIMCIPMGIIAMPLILFQLVNMGIIPEFSFLFSDFHRLVEYRASEVSLSNVIPNLSFLGTLLLGGDGLNYNAFDIKAFGTVYIVMVPMIIIGLFDIIYEIIAEKRKKETDLTDNKNIGFEIILLFLLSSVIMALLISQPSINRANEIFMPFMVLGAVGIVCISKRWKLFMPAAIIVLCLFYLAYGKFYFLDQKERYGYMELFLPTISVDMINYSVRNFDSQNDKTIYIEEEYEDVGASVFFLHEMANIPPTEFDENRTDFGKYQLHFPEEFDENENAIYIIGNNWNHITGYLQSIGYNVDTGFEGYSIVYK